MDYIEVSFAFDEASAEQREIIVALLGYIDFESFTDSRNGIQAYIAEPLFNEELMNETLSSLDLKFTYKYNLIKAQNWNAEWEKSFEPIYIDNRCQIRAPFHKRKENIEYDLVIEPKMSFGTGHHETTGLMVRTMLDIDFNGKTVLDMGCGTGVLAILASKRNAKSVTAIDIDSWAYENTLENIERNNTSNIITKQGDASLLMGEKFDVILANINRNILLSDMSIYVGCLPNNGHLVLSGFYSQDLTVILDKAQQIGLKYESHIENNNWIAVKLIHAPN